jgi:hypothetical protein
VIKSIKLGTLLLKIQNSRPKGAPGNTGREIEPKRRNDQLNTKASLKTKLNRHVEYQNTSRFDVDVKYAPRVRVVSGESGKNSKRGWRPETGRNMAVGTGVANTESFTKTRRLPTHFRLPSAFSNSYITKEATNQKLPRQPPPYREAHSAGALCRARGSQRSLADLQHI